ncbi:MAG TPA: prolyl aminopeptidase [Pseudomonadales bacterium]
MIILYPDIRPYTCHHLEVDSTHTLYLEESGHRDGIPVLCIHGGPGAGSESLHRRFFNPDDYRIILYDQRGAGKSTPHAELKDNTTKHLLDDIETIRNFLGIERWALFGGSWGSTLALLYAQQHPEKILGMILRGIFLCRQQDLDWFYQGHGANKVFPEAWQEFENVIPQSERSDMISAYYKRLTGADDVARMHAAKAWSIWEGHCATLRPNHNVLDHFNDPHRAVSLARLEAHYFKNKAFIEANQIIKNINTISEVPGIIVHGRYDMICPLENAYTLHKAWPASKLNVVRDAGHSCSDSGIIDGLVRATEQMAKNLRGPSFN